MTAPIPDLSVTRRQARVESPFGMKDGNWYTIAKDFQQLPPIGAATGAGDPDFSGTGTGTVPALTFLAPRAGYGGVLLATRTATAADNDEARLFPFTTSRWGSAVQPASNTTTRLEARIRTGASVAETAIYFGLKLTDTGVLATDNDQAYILFDTDATSPAGSVTNFVAVSSVGGTDTVTASGVTVAAATDYDLRVEIGPDRRARFWVNGGLFHTAATAFAGSENLLPTFGVLSRVNAGGAKSHGIRFIRLSRFVA